MTDFQVIFFNAGGTLIQLRNTTLPILYSQLLSRILKKSVSSEEIFLAFRKAEAWVLSRRIPGALFSDLDQRKYQNVFYGQLGISNRKEINWIEKQIADELEMDFVLEKGTKTILCLLKQKYQLGLISNWDASLIDILQNLGILDYFDSITLSGDIGISKPDATIFKSALEDFPEVKPKETVYIGDEYLNDIVPAQKLKMFAILFDKGPSGMHGRPFQTDVKCTKIKELEKLPEILNKHAIVRKY
ncbi:MAG: HAD-IA family hydrolase [Candidatus Heimdallarchaeota archaeon]|nr:MAG: HAD-IA family hydrolase [Candidatus Heimdallarchaeota archaeon]